MKRARTTALVGIGWMVLLCGSGLSGADDTPTELEHLKRTVSGQAATIEQQQATIQQLVEKMASLEAKVGGVPVPKPIAQQRVSLETEEMTALPSKEGASGVLGRPWYQNFQVGGFGAGGFIWTGRNASRAHGGFLNYEAALDVDAQVWDKVHFYHELRTVRMGDDNTINVQFAEVYLRFQDVMQTLFGMDSEQPIGVKLGRMDIPFGEDYLLRRSINNPLITLPAAFPYGFDEGLVFYGALRGVHWIASLMDGSKGLSTDDNSDKFLSLKLYGNPLPRLYLSGSVFRNGKTNESAWELGGSHLTPLGAGGLRSARGTSTSSSINAYSYEFDAKYSLGEDRYLGAQFGSVLVDDRTATTDRTIYYFKLEPKWNLGPRLGNKWYLIGRLSAVGTFNDHKGYAFDGEPFAGGGSTFGFDTKALYRWAVGLGYWPNPGTLIKLEYSKDDFRKIVESSVGDTDEQRDFLGLLVASKF